MAGWCFGDMERSEIGVPGDPGGVEEGVRGILWQFVLMYRLQINEENKFDALMTYE